VTSGGGAGAEALVVRVSGPTATLLVDGGEREARLPPRLPGRPVVAGDRVAVRQVGDDLLVERIAPRATRLDRGQGLDRRARPLVANADLLLVVASVVDPELRPRLVDRYLVAGHAGGLEGGIVITKTDLPHDAAALERVVVRYRDAGYPVLLGAATGDELPERVRDLVDRRVAVLAGPSGVGKSTLTRALTGVERTVGAISAKARTGRHTTSDPRLIPLPGGGAIVDTAGVRTFHLPVLDARAIEAGFPEIAAAGRECRFRGCRHDGEPGCAVAGRVSEERLDSYRRMIHDLA
jgi:ribosome biogenesis GTPase